MLAQSSSKNIYYKKPGHYRVLLVYPNIQQCAMMPYSIGLFTSLLKQEGRELFEKLQREYQTVNVKARLDEGY